MHDGDPTVYIPMNKAWREADQEHARVHEREHLAKRRAEDHIFKIKELLRVASEECASR
jgi:hypothetical protein